MSDTDVMGGSALLRVAAFPSRPWLRAANADLFRAIRCADDAELRYRASARAVAERIGAELVPRAALTTGERARALALRRRLHHGDEPRTSLLHELAAIAIRVGLPAGGLPAALHAVAARHAQVTELTRQTAAAVADEEARLLGLPWELATAAPAMARAMRQADPGLFGDIERRVAGGAAWHTKRMRRRSDYLWRLVDRGTAKPTPRAWFAHVGLVPIADTVGRDAGLAVTDEVASQWVENLHQGRRALLDAGLERADPATLLTVTPLHWHDGPALVAWLTTVDDTVRVTEVRVRRTPLLEAVCGALRLGARALGDVEAAVSPAADDRGRTVLRKFLSHLAGIGIIEVCRPPELRLRRWGSSRPEVAAGDRRRLPTEHTRTAGARGGDDGYLDVYRRVTGTLPRALYGELEDLAGQALRVLALIDDDLPRQRGGRAGDLAAEPRSVLDLLRQRPERAEPAQAGRSESGWPRPDRDESGYARLLEWIGGNADRPALDLTPDLLDRVGAPAVELAWPLDCLLRLLPPGGGPVGALDAFCPAGLLDARFADAFRSLYGTAPHVTAYREFLQSFEERTGFLLVEVLVPPLSSRAANAVRRPRYTTAWTGDADLATYCGPGDPARYIPLDAIMLRRVGGRVVATVDGRQIWPVHHATRSALPPWNLLVELLLSAAPTPLRHARGIDLRRSLAAFPDRAFLPRITVSDRLVLSCAQWRVGRERLWEPGTATLTKARTLDALRRQLALPRWIFLVGRGPGGVCCDLESLRTVRAFDRALETGAESVLITESLPSPADFPVADDVPGPPARLAAELMVRLPAGPSPPALARRAAHAVREQAETTAPGT